MNGRECFCCDYFPPILCSSNGFFFLLHHRHCLLAIFTCAWEMGFRFRQPRTWFITNQSRFRMYESFFSVIIRRFVSLDAVVVSNSAAQTMGEDKLTSGNDEIQFHFSSRFELERLITHIGGRGRRQKWEIMMCSCVIVGWSECNECSLVVRQERSEGGDGECLLLLRKKKPLITQSLEVRDVCFVQGKDQR